MSVAGNNPSSSKIRLALVSEEPTDNQTINKHELEGEYTGKKIDVSQLDEIKNPQAKPFNTLEDNKVYLGKQTLENGHIVFWYITNDMSNWEKIDNDHFAGGFPNDYKLEPYKNEQMSEEAEEGNPAEEGAPTEGTNPTKSLEVVQNPKSDNPVSNPAQTNTSDTTNINIAAKPVQEQTVIAQTTPEETHGRQEELAQNPAGNLARNPAGNTKPAGNPAGNPARNPAGNTKPAVNPAPAGNSPSAETTLPTGNIAPAETTLPTGNSPSAETPAVNPSQVGGSRRKRKYSFKSKKQMMNKLMKGTLKK